jgi:hypothetical protein
MTTPAQQHPCFGCERPIADTPGNAYCDACIAEQTARARDERAAFDAYHRFADASRSPLDIA